MGNSLNSTHEEESQYLYIQQAGELVKNQPPRKGGEGFNHWGVKIIRKLKRSKATTVNFRMLGAVGPYFDLFFRPLLPEVTKLTGDNLRTGLVTEEKSFEECKKELENFKKGKPTHLDVKLAVLGDTSPDSMKFQNQVEMGSNSAVVNQIGSNKFGIILGPLFLAWDKSGLVIPELLTPMNALCILDLKTKVELNSENLMKIAESCCHFNKYYEYSPFLVLKKAHEATSHSFVWLVLKETLGLKEFFPPKGAIDTYLRNMLISDIDMMTFKGFSYTTESQVRGFFKVHSKKKPTTKEGKDLYELMKGFLEAFRHKRIIQQKRDEKRRKYDDFQRISNNANLSEYNPAFKKEF